MRVSTASPTVSEQGAMAKALGYVHDGRTVDAARRMSRSYCSNCALFEGRHSDTWARCSVFPGKLVAATGWCGAWANGKQPVISDTRRLRAQC